MDEMRYETIIYWDSQDGIFIVEVPELPGCMARGSSKPETLRHVEEAASLWIDPAKEDGMTIPTPKGRLLFA